MGWLREKEMMHVRLSFRDILCPDGMKDKEAECSTSSRVMTAKYTRFGTLIHDSDKECKSVESESKCFLQLQFILLLNL